MRGLLVDRDVVNYECFYQGVCVAILCVSVRTCDEFVLDNFVITDV